MRFAARERIEKIENVKNRFTSSFNVFFNSTSFVNVFGLYLCYLKEGRCLFIEIFVRENGFSLCTSLFNRDFPHSDSDLAFNQALNKRELRVQVTVGLTENAQWNRDIVKVGALSSSNYRSSNSLCWRVIGKFVVVNRGLTNRDLLRRSGDVESNPGPILGSGSGASSSSTSLGHYRCVVGSAGSPTVSTSTSTPIPMPESPSASATSSAASTSASATITPNGTSNGTSFESGKTKAKCDLQVMSLNVRGLGDKKKLRHLINYCYKRTKEAIDSVYLLQETHSNNLGLIKYIWRGDYCETAGTGASKGCITLLSPMLKVLKVKHYDQRAHIAIIGKSDEMRAEMLIVNVYAPNKNDREKLEFFIKIVEDLTELAFEYNCDKVIFAGDLNLVFDKEEVKNRACPLTEKTLSSSVKEILTSAGLRDGWDDAASSKNFTWMVNRNGKQLFSTLDRVFYNNTKLTLTSKVVDWSVAVSDHAAVFAKFNNSKTSVNKTHIARLDPSLLKDEASVAVLDEHFKDLFGQKLAHWTPHQVLDYAKLCIRTAANAATNFRKSQYRDDEAEVNSNINNLIGKLADMEEGHPDTELTQACLNEQRNIKRDLVNKIGTKLEQRTSRKWYNEGELSNKYFLNILRRKVNDSIDSLEISEVVTHDPNEISDGIVEFYKELYEVKETDGVRTNDRIFVNEKKDFFRKIEPILPEEEMKVIDPMTTEELRTVLDGCVDSAPGPDGIPYSYLKHFWKDFGEILALAWNHSMDKGELPESHKQSYLKLIPKAGKDLTKLTNWRPITLSNTDHKLVTKAYSKRVTKAVMSKISEEQTAYIEGRLINDNVRAMIRTIDLANEDPNVDGIVISLDARKAFDSVNHNYIKEVLTAFGLEKFVKIFDILYKGLRSDIIINGGVKRGFKIERGVKQGDALSCILFIMCIEPLLCNIKSNPTIAPIRSDKIGFDLPKAYSYADDITALTLNRSESVQALFSEYERLSKFSGLILNADKTELLCFNQQPNVRVTHKIRYLGETFEVMSLDKIKVNGIFLMQDPERRIEANVKKVTEAINRQMTSWSSRSLSLLGKILIVKTFAVSQTIYLMQTCVIPLKFLKLIEAPVYKFLWNKNFRAAKAPDRIKREIITTPVALGGFGLLNLTELDRGIKLKAFGRLLVTGHPFFAQLRRNINCNNFFEPIINGADEVLKEGLKHLKVDRLQVLDWPVALQTSCTIFMAALRELRIADLISQAGKRTIQYILLGRDRAEKKVKGLSERELETIIPHLKNRGLEHAIRACRGLNLVKDHEELVSLYPVNQGQMGDLRKLSSQKIRKLRTDDQIRLICIYKIGLILDPAEVMAWTKKCRKLTSVRHRSTILRIAHGDILSNSRLFKFGLKPLPQCENCNCESETIVHKILNCPVTQRAWSELSAQKEKLGMVSSSSPSLEEILGVRGEDNKLAMAMNMELLVKILSYGGKSFDPINVTRRALRSIYINEPMCKTMRTKLKAIIETEMGNSS